MATETSSSSESSVQKKRIVWFYQSNSNPNEETEWKRYSDFESDFIEEAFQKKEHEEIAFDNCLINFKENMQFNKNNKNQHSSVKREEVSVNDLIRKERFSDPEPVQIKSFESNFRLNIVNKWLRKNQKIKDDYAAVAELAALGIAESISFSSLFIFCLFFY
jgi:hypothetical protein